MSARDEKNEGERASRVPRNFGYGGLCTTCRHLKVISSDKGSTFLMCRRAATDPRFAKYPPQPVRICAGHEAQPAQ